MTSKHQYSLFHEILEEKRVDFVTLDLETGGPKYGILQLSAQVLDMSGNQIGKFFNQYVKPKSDAVFFDETVKVHGLHNNDPRLKEANEMNVIWSQFVAFVNCSIPDDYVGVLVAWNGQSCDLDWIYRIMKDPNWKVDDAILPQQCPYFMDPMHVIRSSKSCAIHLAKSQILNLKLQTVFEYLAGEEMVSPHNAMFDVMAQT